MPVRAHETGRRAHAALPATATCSSAARRFAGLAVARELAGSGARRARARPLRDRRAPDLRVRGADRVAARRSASRRSIRQTFGDLVIHTPATTLPLDAAVDVLDLRLPRAVRAAVGRRRRRRASRRRRSTGAHRAARRRRTPTAATCRAPLIVDALGWRRVLGDARAADPAARGARCRAGSRSTRTAPATTSSCGSTRATCARATRGASPPATSCASASARSTRATTSRSRPSAWRDDLGARRRCATRATGSRTACAPPTEDGVFFVGDSAGHCLPTTAEGIRTALLLRHRLRARAARRARGPRDARGRRCAATPPSATSHRWKFEAMKRVQDLVPRVPPRALTRCPRRRSSASASPTGRSTTTWPSPRRSSPARRRPRVRLGRGPWPRSAAAREARPALAAVLGPSAPAGRDVLVEVEERWSGS